MKLQVVTNDQSNPHPETNRPPGRRVTTRAMYNATRY